MQSLTFIPTGGSTIVLLYQSSKNYFWVLQIVYVNNASFTFSQSAQSLTNRWGNNASLAIMILDACLLVERGRSLFALSTHVSYQRTKNCFGDFSTCFGFLHRHGILENLVVERRDQYTNNIRSTRSVSDQLRFSVLNFLHLCTRLLYL